MDKKTYENKEEDRLSTRENINERADRKPASFKLSIVNKQNDKKIIFLLLVVLLTFVVSISVYLFFFQSQSNDATSPDDNLPTSSGAEKVISGVKGVLKSPLLPIKQNKFNFGETSNGTIVYKAPTLRTKGYIFKNGPSAVYGFAVFSPSKEKTNIDKDYDYAVNFLTSKGMNQSKDSVVLESSKKIVEYTNREYACSISLLYDIEERNYLGIACANVTSYKEAANLLNPFSLAFAPSNPDTESTQAEPPTFQGDPQIQTGIDGYQSAEVNMNNFIGLFYKSPTGNWTYFSKLQNDLACSSFNTADLKKAFSGYRCIDSNGSTISLSS